ncbi:MAG: sulfurtransferase [Myxococcales bacterium]|nr:sulfurtransferase [Myxococcales bacterium]
MVSTQWLEENLVSPELRIFDCTVYLRPAAAEGPYDPESGRADYEAAHIPGAGFLDLIDELSRQDPRLHFMAPSAEQFARAMSRAGVGEAHRVILYSSGHIMWATRLWWMLRAFGFDNAAVLDGGFDKWRAEGRPVSQEPCRYPPAQFQARERGGFFVDRDDVRNALEDSEVCIINALNPDYYRGEGESRYGRPGRIPGSVNVPALTLLRDTHDFVSLEEAERRFAEVGADAKKRVVTYCGGGISATVDNLMLYRLGRDDVATYDASMGEWAQDESLPIERDPTGG